MWHSLPIRSEMMIMVYSQLQCQSQDNWSYLISSSEKNKQCPQIFCTTALNHQMRSISREGITCRPIKTPSIPGLLLSINCDQICSTKCNLYPEREHNLQVYQNTIHSNHHLVIRRILMIDSMWLHAARETLHQRVYQAGLSDEFG